MQRVMQPFAGRLLEAKIAGFLSAITGASLPSVFLTLKICWLTVFGFLLGRLYRSYQLQSCVLLVAISGTAVTAWMSNYMYVELLSSLLLLLVFWFLSQRRHLGFALTAFLLLSLSRISVAYLLFLSLFLTSTFRGFSRESIVRLFGFAGTLVTAKIILSVLTAEAAANRAAVPGPLFFLLKVPRNAPKNLFGLPLWTNTHDFCEPFYSVGISNFFRIGNITDVGVCTFDLLSLTINWASLLSMFGVLPLLLFLQLREDGLQDIRENRTFWECLAVVYGVLAYIAAPFVSIDIIRQGSYGWPAFWLLTPLLVVSSNSGRAIVADLSRRSLIVLGVLQLLLSWLPYLLKLFGYGGLYNLHAALFCFAVSGLGWIFAYRIVRSCDSVAYTRVTEL